MEWTDKEVSEALEKSNAKFEAERTAHNELKKAVLRFRDSCHNSDGESITGSNWRAVQLFQMAQT